MHAMPSSALSSGFFACTFFMGSFVLGLFSVLSMSMIAKAGLFMDSATRVACEQIAGRTTYRLDAWHTITRDNWVLDVFKCGYRLQFEKVNKLIHTF